MLTRLLDRTNTSVNLRAEPVPTPVAPTPSSGYDSLGRFALLAADMIAAVPTNSRTRWNEPAVFFFNHRRQAELEVTRPAAPAANPLAELSARITAEIAVLCGSLDLRRIARATTGLRNAAEALAPSCAAAKELADLLAVPDDEMVTVLHPQRRAGYRLLVRGVADIGQFHILLLDTIGGLMPGPRIMQRFVMAYQDANPTSAGGVPMTAEARFQMYTSGALRTDGSLPEGFGGSDHWLWPHTSLASISPRSGERVILLGPPAFNATWEVTRRFPALAAEVRLLEVLNSSQVADRLGKLI